MARSVDGDQMLEDAVALLVELTAVSPDEVKSWGCEEIRCKYCGAHDEWNVKVDLSVPENHDPSCSWRRAVEWLRLRPADPPPYPQWSPVESGYVCTDGSGNVARVVTYGSRCLLEIETAGTEKCVVLLHESVRLCRRADLAHPAAGGADVLAPEYRIFRRNTEPTAR